MASVFGARLRRLRVEVAARTRVGREHEQRAHDRFEREVSARDEGADGAEQGGEVVAAPARGGRGRLGQPLHEHGRRHQLDAAGFTGCGLERGRQLRGRHQAGPQDRQSARPVRRSGNRVA